MRLKTTGEKYLRREGQILLKSRDFQFVGRNLDRRTAQEPQDMKEAFVSSYLKKV